MTNKKGRDPFDPSKYKVSAYDSATAVDQVAAIPVGNPKSYFMVHPSDEYQIDVMLARHDGDLWFVEPEFYGLIEEDIKPTRLVTVVDRSGEVWLLPISLSQGGNAARRIASALDVLEAGKTRWVKMTWNRVTSTWNKRVALGDLGEPAWPEMSFQELLEKAFAANMVDTRDHPVLKELVGDD